MKNPTVHFKEKKKLVKGQIEYKVNVRKMPQGVAALLLLLLLVDLTKNVGLTMIKTVISEVKFARQFRILCVN